MASPLACAICEEVLLKEDALTCNGKCKRCMHFFCANLTESIFKKMRYNTKANFKCLECKEEIKKLNQIAMQDNKMNSKNKDCIEELSPNDQKSKDNTEEVLTGNNVVQIQGESKFDNIEMYKLIKKDLLESMTEIKSIISHAEKVLNKKIEDVEREVKLNQQTAQEFLAQMQDMKDKIRNSEQEIESLKIVTLDDKKEIQYLRSQINDLNQYTRKNNIELNGVTECQDENIELVLRKLAAIVNFDIQDILEAHRIPTRTRNIKPIIVKMKSNIVKRNWINAAKKVEILNNQITNSQSAQKVYLNEHLSQTNRALFFQVRKTKKLLNYKFAWTNNGSIYIRKNTETKIIRIRNEEDLKKIPV